jgi:hypothetical protein
MKLTKPTIKFGGQVINISNGNYIFDIQDNNLSINPVESAQLPIEPIDVYDVPDNILPFMKPTIDESLSHHLNMNGLPVLDITKHGSAQLIVKQTFKKVGDKAIILANNDKTIRGAFYTMGRSCSASRTNKKVKRGPFHYLVVETDYQNSYTKAAAKPTP